MTETNPDLRELARAVGGGEWSIDAKHPHIVLGSLPDGMDVVIANTGGDWDMLLGQWRVNAAYIAAANPKAVLAILDERDALSAENARLLVEVEAIVDAKVREIDQVYDGAGHRMQESIGYAIDRLSEVRDAIRGLATQTQDGMK